MLHYTNLSLHSCDNMQSVQRALHKNIFVNYDHTTLYNAIRCVHIFICLIRVCKKGWLQSGKNGSSPRTPDYKWFQNKFAEFGGKEQFAVLLNPPTKYCQVNVYPLSVMTTRTSRISFTVVHTTYVSSDQICLINCTEAGKTAILI